MNPSSMPCSPPPRAAVPAPEGFAMLELRKDIFADERDDDLKEIGKGTQRQDMLGHVTGPWPYFNAPKLQAWLHLKWFAAPIPTRACAASTPAKRNVRKACVASSAAPTCRATSTRCSA